MNYSEPQIQNIASENNKQYTITNDKNTILAVGKISPNFPKQRSNNKIGQYDQPAKCQASLYRKKAN